MNLHTIKPEDLSVALDLLNGDIAGRARTERHLHDLKNCFQDQVAYESACALGNPLLYSVVGVEPTSGEGQLHYGIGKIMPGKIGNEYYLTKGHLHTWRDAAEVYIGFSGRGMMLLEDEVSGETRMVSLGAGDVVYVPGHTAHRTMNTGTEPLIYLGVYPSAAGHDYGAIATKNFKCCVVEKYGKPTCVERISLS